MKNSQKIEIILKELIEKNQMESIPDFFSEKYKVHTSKKVYEGHKIIKKWAKDLHNFLYDLKIVKIEFLINEENTLVWKRTIKGKIKPSSNKNLVAGRIIKWDEMIVSKFESGLITEEWSNSEFLGELISKRK